ncbi:MAG: hypothetical protein ACOCRO_03065 [Halanaerobiales bacterium]
MSRIKNLLLPILLVILVFSSLGYLYFFILSPLQENVAKLENERDMLDLELLRLLRLRSEQDQYEAEMIELKTALDRYQNYATEYGSYDNMLLLIRDIERRADVTLKEVELTGQDLNFQMESDYHGLRIFISSLENINYLYTAEKIMISGIRDRFSPNFSERDENNLNVTINANFALDNVASMKNKIQVLIEEIGLRNAYIE